MDPADKVKLGRLVKPFGVRGEIRLVLDENIEALRVQPEALFLWEAGRLFPWFVASWRVLGDGACLVSFEGIQGPEHAKGLCGHDVYVGESEVTLADSEDGWEQLLGFSLLDQDGTSIGTITDLIQATAQPIAVVEAGNRSVLVPLDEGNILGVDEVAKTIQVDIPDGLLDL